jgi:hypothetical protein
MQQSRDDRSLGELFADLSRQMTLLIRQEMALAKTEMTEKATTAGKNLAYIALGAAILYAGFLALVATAIIAIAHALAWWLSALIVGLVVAAVGAFLVERGREALKHANLTPQQTVESLKEDQQWMKEQI